MAGRPSEARSDVSAKILDGKATLGGIKLELRERVARLAERGIVPGLGTVLVGDDPGSRWYVNAKHKDSAEIGINSIRRDLPAGTSQAEVEAVVDELNADPACTAFLVQQPTGLDENATVTICHTGTRDLAAEVRRADIVVAAAGSPSLVTADMVKPGAVVLDAGVSRVDGKIAGDVAPDVAEVAGWLSPNPGGVGPMTRAMLLSNVVEAAERAG